VTPERVSSDSNALQQLAHVAYLLVVQFSMQWPSENMDLVANRAFQRSMLRFTIFTQRFEQGAHVMPLNIVRGGVTKNLFAGGTVVAIEMWGFAH
jgi:hypothetical protein